MLLKQGTRFHELSEDELKAVRIARKIIKALRRIAPGMPTSYADAFLAVAEKPRGGPSDYAKDLNTIQPIMSRLLLEIGKHPREKEKGLDLVDRQISAHSLAKQEYFLTQKGRDLLKDIIDIVKGS